MPLGSGKTLMAARALVEMGRRRAFKEMQYYTLTQSAEKAKKKVAKTVRKRATAKAKETYQDWRDEAPAGFEYRPPVSRP